LKANVDIAVKECECVENIVVVKRTGNEINWSDRDVWYHDLVEDVPATCPCEMFDAETPLFILYTSGSTGKPKGVLILQVVTCCMLQ
jgi:acetyl-CoA synthetase